MEKGDLCQRVEVQSRDEIGRLAQAFNAMAEGLTRLEQLRRNMVTDVAHELKTVSKLWNIPIEDIANGIIRDALIDNRLVMWNTLKDYMLKKNVNSQQP